MPKTETYHRNKVIIGIGVFFKCQDKLRKAGMELHDAVEIILIVPVNSVRVVSTYI